MTVRERMEQEEYDVLAPHAQKAAESQGRLYPEEDNDVRTCYQRDADRILHSKSFRRLMHKTQVFLSPQKIKATPHNCVSALCRPFSASSAV